ncbi:HpsJ-like protein, cyanoexosortase C-associated [Leptolyngbya sp. AN03gr2]|uniref:HpsJ-like protein, cyanoexosortase C-associated n=1 Tax=unclassified Leptolyngbya TaxID=2650499 RepID=UPI003D31EEB9
MTFISKKNTSASGIESSRAKRLCRIVGFACLIAFLVDFLVIVFPVNFVEASWRLGTLQQIGNRSIVVLFGLALLIYGAEQRKTLRSLSLICFTIGISFLLFCPVVAQDSLALQRQALDRIGSQSSQISSRLEAIQGNPNAARATPEQLEQATQQLNARTESAKQAANNSIFKSGFLSVGNFAVIGVSLLILGRYGLYLFRH